MSAPLVRRRLRFSGRVQGVGFRWRARQAAEAFGVTGWVRNEADGAVSMELQGSEAQIDRVLDAVARGLCIRVDDLQSRKLPLVPDERGFVTLDDAW